MANKRQIRKLWTDAVWTQDCNNDCKVDFLYAGNDFPVEVETARYDGFLHGICFGDGNGGFQAKALTSLEHPFTEDYRDIV